MHRFDYSFLSEGMIPAKFVNFTSGISALGTSAKQLEKEYPEIFSGLLKTSKINSVRCSNAIEGIVTSDERIAGIVSGKISPSGHDEAEIAGYRDALSLIHTNYKELDMRVGDILMLHETMMKPAGNEYGGVFKNTDNLILETDSDGNRSVRFRPVSAADTPKAMEQLELAYIEASCDSNINGLLLIPCVILDLLCIHPFKDGNGRISRLMTLLLLYKNGHDVCRYVSLEEMILKYKDFYYKSLGQSSEGWENNENSYFPFMQNFLSMLYMCYKELDGRF